MKIIFYGTRDYDHLYFDVLAADPDYGCTIKFLAANLDPDTAQLAAGGDAVCAFVNSDCGAETLSVLAKAGIKLLLMRCAGYNNVDLAAAKANGITVMRVPGYSPEAVAEQTAASARHISRCAITTLHWTACWAKTFMAPAPALWAPAVLAPPWRASATVLA